MVVPSPIELRPSTPWDVDWLVELRAEVLRGDLERLGRFDPVRVRQRMRDAFAAEHTRIIVEAGRDVGSIASRPEGEARWIEHFYISPSRQGRGVGSVVLRTVLEGDDDRAFRLNVLQGSAARRLYERFGFLVDSEDAVDVYMTRPGQ